MQNFSVVFTLIHNLTLEINLEGHINVLLSLIVESVAKLVGTSFRNLYGSDQTVQLSFKIRSKVSQNLFTSIYGARRH